MTITYPNGTVRKAIVLSHEDNELRAAAAGCDDVLTFTRVEGIWISEDLQPVTFEFEWQRRVASPVPREEDCICPGELADRLISGLHGGSEPREGGENKLYVFSPEGIRVAIHVTDLIPN